MAARADAALGAIDRTAAAAAQGVGKVATKVLGEQNLAVVASLNSKAEEAAAAVHARGKNYFRLCNMITDAVAGFFAKYTCIVFFFSLLGFCLAAGLLAYTEQNADPLFGFGCVDLCTLLYAACLPLPTPPAHSRSHEPPSPTHAHPPHPLQEDAHCLAPCSDHHCDCGQQLSDAH